MAIDKTILQYKELNQLQEYAMAQQTTIIQLSKKIQKIEDERDHLKTLLESSVPLLKTQPEGVNQISGDDTEYICTVEISKLKNMTLERELTYEECKRLDTYFRILNQINSRPTQREKEVKDLKTEDQLKLVENNGNDNK